MHAPSTIRRTATAGAATAAALLLTAGAAQADLDPERLRQVTDQYLFELELAEFTAVREQQPHPDQLDWTSDSCSLSPDEPLGHDFATSCDRHDFGYRNYTRQERFTEPNRELIDDRFRDDMYSVCGGDPLCRGTADVYHFAVRQFGGVANSTAQAIEMAQIEPGRGADGGFRATDARGERVHLPG
ncbi:hypothetical protein IQ251_07480 [Saccharopolyspora sp. HNM0983]|uniref:Phospholipase A2-like protein n=1 Tax=Saccharopolyspora montiporae TaxID=2781240 RepID=A0A929FZZ9_9PSEU|nr:hypothetical protein [Saccharopolyspora sp. HNM0983]